jgi:hypothetical protein
MPLAREAARLGQFPGDAFNTVVAKLLDSSAARANHVLVLGNIARRLKTAESFPEVALHNEPALE